MTTKTNFALSNPIEVITCKSKYDWNTEDLLSVIQEKKIEIITFHYTGWDGKIKDLRIPITDYDQAVHILTDGERVDGSSLFKGVVDAGKSDLYVVPVYRTAFINPFDPTSLDFVCRFFDKNGELASFAPDNILLNLSKELQTKTSYELYALSELEFYLIQEPRSDIYKLQAQSGYHASSPFVKSSAILDEILKCVATTMGNVKYAHFEVGTIENLISDFKQFSGKNAEQVEIEFQLAPIEEAADMSVVAMWIIRNVANRHNALATFYPKLEIGHAGNGLHFHLALKKDSKNIMLDENCKLSKEALTLIGGLVKYAPSLTAFGNLVAGSYLRLVPHQEAPTKVCWSEMNRSAMIRVPLAWTNVGKLSDKINPSGSVSHYCTDGRQTVEIRTPDGSANIHLLLAGIAKAAIWAFENQDYAISLANKHYVSGNIHDNPEYSDLPEISDSCESSAEALMADKALYISENGFPEKVIQKAYDMLKAERDKNLNTFIAGLPVEERNNTLRRIIHKAIIERNI